MLQIGARKYGNFCTYQYRILHPTVRQNWCECESHCDVQSYGGAIWFRVRGLWSWALPFLVIEMLAIVQIVGGLFGNFAADAFARIASIEGTLDLRR